MNSINRARWGVLILRGTVASTIATVGVLSALGGCASTGKHVARSADGPAVYLAAYGDEQDMRGGGGSRRLGAGDALGQAIFARYVAYVRAHGPARTPETAVVAAEPPHEPAQDE